MNNHRPPQPALAPTAASLLSRRDLLKSGLGVLGSLLLPNFLPGSGGAGLQTDPKRIYIAADDHTDYYWAGDEEAYRQAFLDMLDYYLDLTDATADLPPGYQSRWNCDGSFWLWTYERNRSPAEFERLIARIRDGHISAPLNPLVVCLGGAPAEAVLRGMYYAGQLERRYQLRFPLAIAMENQTLPFGLGSLWAGSGARYSWRGICNCATRVTNAGDREHEIYWWVGPDGSRILMKWNSQLVDSTHMGGYAEARRPELIVTYVDRDPDFIARYPYRVIGAFGYGWDDLQTFTDAFVRTAPETSNAERRVIVSNEEDFFRDFEATYGDDIPSLSTTFGNEWDLYCTSMAEVSAQVKRLVERLRSAEALATLVSFHDPAFMAGRAAARDQAFMNIGLYWEHNWTANGVVGREPRAQWQRRLVEGISAYVDTLYQDAAGALGDLIQPGGTDLRFYTFNPLNWTRTDVADLPYSGPTPVHVIDLSTGEETPSQVVTLDGEAYLRILARDVPSLGYKVFEVRPGEGLSFEDAATVTDNVLASDRYAVALSERGAITSLIDRALQNREFAREIDGRFINDLGPGGGALTVENAGPVSVTLLAAADGPLAHTTRLTLTRDLDRIDIRNTITQNFGNSPTWAFSFNLDAPDVWHEEVGAIIRARLLPDGGHYSPRNARYDWLTLNHFADMSGSDGAGVTLANADCYFMQLGASAPDTLDTDTPQISVLAGGQVDGGGLGIPDQHGDSYFLQRFALRTRRAYDPVAAMRFALEHQNPLVTGVVSGAGRAYPETSYSLLTVSDPNLFLWALKPADDADGIIARLWNLSSQAVSFSLGFAERPVASAWQTTHIETILGAAAVSAGALSATIGPQQILTFLLRFGEPQAQSDPLEVVHTAPPTVPPPTPTATAFPSVLPNTDYLPDN